MEFQCTMKQVSTEDDSIHNVNNISVEQQDSTNIPVNLKFHMN